MKKVKIGNRWVGEGEPCFVIAEAGSNHNRDFNQALKLIDVAVEAGADAVKFQTYSAEKTYSKKTPKMSYLKKACPRLRSGKGLAKRMSLSMT